VSFSRLSLSRLDLAIGHMLISCALRILTCTSTWTISGDLFCYSAVAMKPPVAVPVPPPRWRRKVV